MKIMLTQPGKLRLYSTTELIKMPPPIWLIETIMPEQGVIGLYGAPGTGKSFVAIDFALSIATGRPWHGRAVQQGLVIYISAEGGAGIGKRVLAWCNAHHVSPASANLAWVIEAIPIQADSADVTRLFERMDELHDTPVLVVIDTLARCFDGDENQQEDMGAFVKGVDAIRHALGTAVMIVHHTRLDGDRERGNTAFRGAADTMIQVKRNKDAAKGKLTLLCDKQKDDEEFAPIPMSLVKCEDENSCIVTTVDLSPSMREFVTALRDAGVTPGTSHGVAALEELSGLPRATFFRHLSHAKKEGIVEKRGSNYVLKI